MSYKILKTIEMDLTRSSINRAIREIQHLKTELENALSQLVSRLMDEGVEVAKMQVVSMDAFDTGELEGSIHRGDFLPDKGIGYIVAGAPYAVFVEYGTGMPGRGSPHPGINDEDWTNPVVAGDHGKVYNDYNSQHHGWKGWTYISDKDGKKHWTVGYVSRPFMYNTLRWLEDAAPERASELFAQM